jgi:hypothetical protein
VTMMNDDLDLAMPNPNLHHALTLGYSHKLTGRQLPFTVFIAAATPAITLPSARAPMARS